MGKLFTLDAETKQTIQDALDDILINTADGGLGTTCLLVYPPAHARCDNCVYDNVNQKSANRPVSGAPVPFQAGGSCPLCGGSGRRDIESTEEITLKCSWEYRKFLRPVPTLELRVPGGALETKGYVKDLPKILKADHLIANLPFAPYLRQRFRLAGEPGDPSSIIQGRYFVATWERWNG